MKNLMLYAYLLALAIFVASAITITYHELSKPLYPHLEIIEGKALTPGEYIRIDSITIHASFVHQYRKFSSDPSVN